MGEGNLGIDNYRIGFTKHKPKVNSDETHFIFSFMRFTLGIYISDPFALCKHQRAHRETNAIPNANPGAKKFIA